MADPVRGASQPSWALNPYQVNIQYQTATGNAGVGMGGSGWFGPLQPIVPTAPPDVAGREWDFIPGYNLATFPRTYEPVTFETLSRLSRAYDPLRLVIETRKDQMTRQVWDIRPRLDRRKNKLEQVTPDQQRRIDALKEFFKRPDGVMRYRPWIRKLLDDLFVYDAPTLYCRRTNGGKLVGLRHIDGSRIKPVIDDWGRTPEPIAWDGKPFIWNSQEINEENWRVRGFKKFQNKLYPPAYQEVLHGLPAVDYTTRDLLYRPYNPKSDSPYGYSPVEQVLITVNIAMRRQQFQFEYYKSGSVPDALIGVPDTWNPNQLAQFQDWWDSTLSGQLAERRRTRFVPGGTSKIQLTKEPDLAGQMDEWMVRIICFAFSIPPNAFVKMMNRAQSEVHKEEAEEEGLEPLKCWVKDLFDEIIEVEFDSPDLEWAWAEEVDIDPEKQQQIVAKNVEAGLISVNQGRDSMGLAPDPNPAADMLMVRTPNGYIPIEALTIDGRKEMQQAFPNIEPGDEQKPTAAIAAGKLAMAGAG